MEPLRKSLEVEELRASYRHLLRTVGFWGGLALLLGLSLMVTGVIIVQHPELTATAALQQIVLVAIAVEFVLFVAACIATIVSKIKSGNIYATLRDDYIGG